MKKFFWLICLPCFSITLACSAAKPTHTALSSQRDAFAFQDLLQKSILITNSKKVSRQAVEKELAKHYQLKNTQYSSPIFSTSTLAELQDETRTVILALTLAEMGELKDLVKNFDPLKPYSVLVLEPRPMLLAFFDEIGRGYIIFKMNNAKEVPAYVERLYKKGSVDLNKAEIP